MDNDLRKRIEELQKRKKKMESIQLKEVKEKDNFRKYIAKERANFNSRVEQEKRDLEKRHADEKRALEAKIENERREAEERIKLLSEKETEARDKFNSLGQSVVSVRLGELVEELANLSGINHSDILVNMHCGIMFNKEYTIVEMYEKIKHMYCSIVFNKEYTIAEMYEMIKQMATKETNDFWSLSLSSTMFHYVIGMVLSAADLDGMQIDGITFLEHCRVKVLGSMIYLDINEKFDDLIVNIPLSDLICMPDVLWHPKDLMKQAIINCVERSQEKDVSKKRSRKLSDETKKVEVND